MLKSILSVLAVFVLFYQAGVNAAPDYSRGERAEARRQLNEYDQSRPNRSYNSHKVKYSGNIPVIKNHRNAAVPFTENTDSVMREHH